MPISAALHVKQTTAIPFNLRRNYYHLFQQPKDSITIFLYFSSGDGYYICSVAENANNIYIQNLTQEYNTDVYIETEFIQPKSSDLLIENERCSILYFLKDV